jgi:hypothetical protein
MFIKNNNDYDIKNRTLVQQYDYMIYEIVTFYPELFNEYTPHGFFINDYSNNDLWTDNFDDSININGIEKALGKLDKYYTLYPTTQYHEYLPYVRKCYDLWQSQTKKS